MKLAWLSWALAIIFVMAIMDAPIAEAKAVASPEAEADADASADAFANAEAEAEAEAFWAGFFKTVGTAMLPYMIDKMPEMAKWMQEKIKQIG
uniref:Venom peptide ECTX1-Rm37a n=1 Tax=Rhytidoponera metallica TaxID=148364 RepID=A0A8U0LTR3_RHYMT|nr:venom peptide precursor ECTX1-Rm37a [Rhytidoponera metallica]